MFPFSALRLAWGAQAVVAQPGRPTEFTDVGVDSRRLVPGALFVAVQGKVPGERYFFDALKRGARGLLGRSFQAPIRRAARAKSVWLFQTEDGLSSLRSLAWDQRRLLECPLVAVTGSNGKTSTKDLLAHLLSARGGVLATQGNFNNHLGVPLTLLRARPGLRYAVLEAGMNHVGELLSLGRLLRPNVGLVLNVGDAHSGNFTDGRRGVARAKEELLVAMGPSGLALVNADDPATAAMGRRFQGRVVTFGRSRGAHLRFVPQSDRGAAGLRAAVFWSAPWGGKPCSFGVTLAQGGPARAAQAAAGLATALALGMDPALARKRLLTWRPAGTMRQELRPLPSGATAVLDAYNASPQSMEAALEFLALSAPLGRRKAVLGCMLELGGASAALHRALGRAARRAGVATLAALGDQAGEVAAAFGSGARAFASDQSAEAAEWIGPDLGPGDWCLFKGSRGLAVERVFQALQGA